MTSRSTPIGFRKPHISKATNFTGDDGYICYTSNYYFDAAHMGLGESMLSAYLSWTRGEFDDEMD